MTPGPSESEELGLEPSSLMAVSAEGDDLSEVKDLGVDDELELYDELGVGVVVGKGWFCGARRPRTAGAFAHRSTVP